MNALTRHSWQLALVASGLLAAVGGSMHPEVGPEGTIREELAVMTAHEDWVPGHALLAAAVALLAVGLWGARRSGRWPAADGALKVGVIAVSLYFVESLMHLGASLDSHALAHGDSAPIAFGHLTLAAFLYPVSGLAIAWVAVRVGADWGRLRVLAVTGIVGGLVHAVSVPATLLLPDTETSALFAGAGMMLALWTLSLGLLGLTRPARRTTRSQPVASGQFR